MPRSVQIAGRALERNRLITPGEYARLLARCDAPIDGHGMTPEPWESPDDPDASFAGVLKRLADQLHEETWQAFAALETLGHETFGLYRAAASIGRPPGETRRILGELSNLYLVHEVGRELQSPSAPGVEGTAFALDASIPPCLRGIHLRP